MFVKLGWSGETASGQWRKLDVGTDEIDVQRVMREWFKDDWSDESSVYQAAMMYLTNNRVFHLLEIEAERLLLHTLITRFGSKDPTIGDRYAEVHASRMQFFEEMEVYVYGPERAVVRKSERQRSFTG